MVPDRGSSDIEQYLTRAPTDHALTQPIVSLPQSASAAVQGTPSNLRSVFLRRRLLWVVPVSFRSTARCGSKR